VIDSPPKSSARPWAQISNARTFFSQGRIFFLFFACLSASAQDMRLFHSLRMTDSEPVISAWNVDSSMVGPYYVIESVDSKGRVVELRFMDNKKLMEQSCYVTPIITYEYKENQIVQNSYMASEKLRTELECGDFQKTVYTLKGDSVVSCMNFNTDLGFLRKPNEKDDAGYLEYYNALKQYEAGKEEVCYGIIGYPYSMKKMGGRDPGIKM